VVARPAVLCGGPRAVAPAFTIARYRFDRPQADGEFAAKTKTPRERSDLTARARWPFRYMDGGRSTRNDRIR
jgi:hypothetical protein